MEVKGLTIERLRQQAHDMRKAAKELQRKRYFGGMWRKEDFQRLLGHIDAHPELFSGLRVRQI